jgi:hypothetical protein
MTNVTALVEQAIGSKSPIEGLLEVYNGYAARSRVERMRMKRELAYIKDETLFDTKAMFALPDAFRDDSTPVVGIAPYAATKLEYRLRSKRGLFHADSREVLSFDIPLSVEERRVAKEREQWSAMSPEQRDYNLRMRAMAFTSLSSWRSDYEAHVPPTPKALLPWNPITRRKLHVLFDADWKALPVDPYLLERVNGNQFRVVAHWDLTDKEREIMRLIAR